MYGIDVAGRLPVRKGRAGKAVEGALGADLLGDVAGLARVGALFGRPVRFLVLPSRLFIDVDAGSGDVFLGGIHDNGYRRAAEAESMALGGACLPYGGLVRGRYTGKSRVFIYNTLYPALNLRNIYRYRRFIVDYSSEAQRISLDWLAAVQVFILVCVPVPLAGLLLDMETFSSSYFVWLGVLPTFVFYMMLCYNMLDKNYLIVQPEALKTEDMPPDLPALDRKRLERYLREKKPYLDPKLRITDLAAGLSTNRSYLSAFINKEYGMNFCRLINRCRLMALDRLRVSPANAGKTNMELVLMAGFSGYRNYLRVKKEEDRLALLKVFER